ncbi:PAS domain S-box protein, partial [Desulfobulbus alkaliphilus]|uniref:PAS domain S-box protein n=1 Tax=Desulfobulbus alkaliphilus TaxID=869814 RepID=UPI0019652E12
GTVLIFSALKLKTNTRKKTILISDDPAEAPLGKKWGFSFRHYVNRFFADIHGYNPEELTGRHYSVLHTREQMAAAERLVASMIRDGYFATTTVWHCHQDGTEFPMLMSGILIKDDHGIPQCIATSAIDISAQYQAEKALRESEERFRFLVDNSSDLIWKLKPDGIFSYVAPSWKETLGYDPAFMEDQALQPFVHPDDVSKCEQYISRVLDAGKTLPGPQYRVKHADGTWRWHEGNITPVFGEDGRCLNFVGVSRDITERKQTEAQLEERTYLLENITNNMFDMVSMTDFAGIFTYVGPSHRILGFTPEQLLGTSVFEYVHPDDAAYISAEFTEFVSHPFPDKTRTVEYRQRCKDGSYLWLETMGKILFDDNGSPSSLFFSSRNVTERKQTEEALRHSNELMQYIIEHTNSAVAVHDLDLRYLYVSDRYLRDFRVHEQNIIGKHHYDVFPDLPEKWREVHRKALAGEVSSSERDPYERADGTVDWSRWACRPWYDANGLIGGIIVYTEIITERVQAEAELRESEDKFRQISQNVGEVFWLRSADNSQMLYINPAYEKIWGRTCQSLYENPQSFIDSVHEEDKPAVFAEYARYSNTGKFNLEYRIVRPDGEIRWVQEQSFLVTNPEKQVVGHTGIAVDITERKRLENALRESEASIRNKLKAILEPESDLGSLELADIIDGPTVQALLETFHRITGLGSAIVDTNGKVLVGVGWQDICTKFHRRHHETLRNCQESDTVLACDITPGTFKSYLCKNGMNDMASPIEVSGRHLGNIFLGQFFYGDEEPDVERFREQARCCGFDQEEYLAALDRVPRYDRETAWDVMAFYSRLATMISSLSFSTVKLARALERQRQTELQLRLQSLVLNQIQDRVTVTDLDGVITYVNESVVQALGYSREEIIGASIDKYADNPDQGATQQEILEQTLKYGSWRGEVVNRTADGQEVLMDCRTQTVLDEQGTMVALAGISTDITERKRVEKEHAELQEQLLQAQKMETVGRLAGGVAHDFNNMLGVIIGYAEMALEQVAPDQPMHKALHGIQQAAQRSADLTRQLLAFARKQTIAPRIIDLNETVEGVLKMLRRLIGENIDLIWLPGRNLRPVNMDPSQIDQILANLCVNARDAIEGPGKVTIETGMASLDEAWCAVHTGAAPGRYLLLAVSDNGHGMDRETISHIFEPFFTTKEQGQGTGLGLASVYGAVTQNKGFITVYSEPGQGTTFRIYLPPHVITTEPLPAQDRVGAAARGHETILLVEDEPNILEMTTMMLERQGYTVVAAGTPGEAIRLAQEYPGRIDLLITDVIMPEMNGLDLAGNILTVYPDVQCLFMSGYTASVIARHGVLDKEVNFIQKPFTKNDLTTKVREVLDQR